MAQCRDDQACAYENADDRHQTARNRELADSDVGQLSYAKQGKEGTDDNPKPLYRQAEVLRAACPPRVMIPTPNSPTPQPTSAIKAAPIQMKKRPHPIASSFLMRNRPCSITARSLLTMAHPILWTFIDSSLADRCATTALIANQPLVADPEEARFAPACAGKCLLERVVRFGMPSIFLFSAAAASARLLFLRLRRFDHAHLGARGQRVGRVQYYRLCGG